MKGLIRIAAVVPHLVLGDAAANVAAMIAELHEARRQKASLAVFPELGLCGYTMGDLFFQQAVMQEAETGLRRLRDECPEGIVAVVGIPVRLNSGLYNCAAVISRGRIHGLVPKIYLPNYNEFYEKRWFCSGYHLSEETATLCGETVPITPHQIFRSVDGMTFGVELCEDLWAPIPPSTQLCLGGAELILNLSASNELIGKRDYRRNLVISQSARCQCGYAYVSAGTGESTSDLLFSGHSIVAVCGNLLEENDNRPHDNDRIIADVDLELVRANRLKQTSFCDCTAFNHRPLTIAELPVQMMLSENERPCLRVRKHPFVPQSEENREERCRQIFNLQAAALARRLTVTGEKAIIGISGGLDSTLALLATCGAMDRLEKPRTNIVGVTMPCFGTTDQTYQNALALMNALGITAREVPVREAVLQHFQDIGHGNNDYSVTYENAQARERTQVLMDIANQMGGIVVGTGDLSELALGWCTYNADHMSMYSVNCGIPKTLVRWIVKTASEMELFHTAQDVLKRILDTPISPELLPPDSSGTILHRTEDLIGPYELHDFFLYYCLRYGFVPEKVFDLCCLAFAETYDRTVILKWLRVFYRRFFTQQFKRNCVPDGIKIGSVALSPRGDWRMPSDAVGRTWLSQCDSIQ